MKNKKPIELPTIEELEAEINRKKHKQNQHHLMRNAIYVLIVVAAVTSLISIFFVRALKTFGSSMTPTLEDGDIVAVYLTDEAEPGQLVAFYFNNKLIIKRVIALGGSVVDMDEAGNVFVDGSPLEEPYLAEKALGEVSVEFPFTVPDGQYFVLGDNRITSTDSRSSIIGCVDPDNMLGRVVFKVWPLEDFGKIR
ncbi:MAG: signal peptidase I [Oscillospiraceae bacterium]|nr:signal peptidase I [Oscillospiraceae bacterium]